MINRKNIILIIIAFISIFIVSRLFNSDNRSDQQKEDDNKIESGDFNKDDLENMDFGF
tara:strand:- start:345 stop:518 length:174 start_codon:yes stop_codon:yes gene_type:complete